MCSCGPLAPCLHLPQLARAPRRCVQALKNHVIQDPIMAKKFMDGMSYGTLGPDEVTATVAGGAVTLAINGGKPATVTSGEKMTCAGPAYTISTVLVPGGMLPAAAPGPGMMPPPAMSPLEDMMPSPEMMMPAGEVPSMAPGAPVATGVPPAAAPGPATPCENVADALAANPDTSALAAVALEPNVRLPLAERPPP
jgi:Fasciclin domain